MMRHIESYQNGKMRTNVAIISLCVAIGATGITSSSYATAVVPRGSGTTQHVQRTNNAASRMPTISLSVQGAAKTSASQPAPTQPEQPSEPAPAPEPTPEPGPTPEPAPVIIENKSSQFDDALNTSSAATDDQSSSQLAEMVRRQRAALDTQAATEAVASQTAAARAGGANACDIGLRECMQEKCGRDYTKCAGDGDTAWGDKMNACRRNVNCTGREYAMLAPEIKADRDMNIKLAGYTEVLDCGNSYNSCIVTECGPTYNKCLGKVAGDAAVAKCATIAQNCTQADSGLAARTMEVFASLRVDAEKQIARDEQRLYALRDQMKSQCARLGAMFDERSLDCVYTVNFFAGNSSIPYASKKAYAGSTFDCTQNWFGIDITTFKENAYRYTRAQTSASSALMGAGLGVGVGSLTSGAIGRAMDRQKAQKALNDAQKEHDTNFGNKNAAQDADTDAPAAQTDTEAPAAVTGPDQPATKPDTDTPAPLQPEVSQPNLSAPETSNPTQDQPASRRVSHV